MIHVYVSVYNVSNYNTEIDSITSLFGFAVLSAWVSLNYFLSLTTNYSYLPDTMIGSSGEVARGFIGILPVMIGVAFYSSPMFYMQFRFKDFWNSFMTMFYIMNGDTMFDTMTGINQVSFFYALIWSYLWIWFGVNIFMNVTLAIVGEGYVDMKEFDKKGWLTQQIRDPNFVDEKEQLI